MDNAMAYIAKRGNNKAISSSVSVMVMIDLCLFVTTTAGLCVYGWQLACSNGILDCITGFNVFGILFIIFLTRSTAGQFTFFGKIIFSLTNTPLFFVVFSIQLAFFAIAPFSIAFLSRCFATCTLPVVAFALITFTVQIIWLATICAKTREWFNFLASATSFGYACVRHTCFSIKHLCLEPPSGPVPVCGLSYIKRDSILCQYLSGR